MQAEDYTAEDSPDPVYHNPKESHWYEDFSSVIQNNTTVQDPIGPEYNADSEEIPELEYDWDNGQGTNTESTLITHHNTHSQSECLRRDYTQQLLDLSDNQFYEQETPVNQLQYSCPDPDYYGSSTRRPQNNTP